MRVSNRAILLVLGEVLSAAQLAANSVSGMRPSRVRSAVDLKLTPNPTVIASWQEFTQEIVDYCTVNGFRLDSSTIPSQTSLIQLLRLGEKLGYRCFDERTNQLVVDESCTALNEYATAVAGEIHDPEKKQKLTELLSGQWAYYDGVVTDGISGGTDHRYSRVREDTNVRNQLIGSLCDGEDRLFDLGGLDPSDIEDFKVRVGEILSNRTGYQLFRAMVTAKLLNSTEYAFVSDKDMPIKISKIPNEQSTSRPAEMERLWSGQGVCNKRRECSSYNPDEHRVALTERHIKNQGSTIMHECAHAKHYMMRKDIDRLQLFFVHSALQNPSYRDLFFPPLEEENMSVIVRAIQGNISRDYVKILRNKMADATNNEPALIALRGMFRTLIVNGLAQIVFGPQANKKISDILTPKLMSRAIYVYCVIFRDPGENLLPLYDKRAKFSWVSCEEISTILGVVPFYTTSSGETIALLDRQNQLVYEWREKKEDCPHLSETEAQVYRHHSPLYLHDPELSSAAIGAVLSSVGVGTPKQTFHTLPFSFLCPLFKSKALPFERAAAFPRAFVYRNTDQPDPVRVEQLPPGLGRELFDSPVRKLLREIREGKHSSSWQFLEDFLSALAVEKAVDQDHLDEIKGAMDAAPEYQADNLLKKLSSLEKVMPLPGIEAIVQRIEDILPRPNPSDYTNIHPFISAAKAQNKSIEEYKRETEYYEDLANIQLYLYNPRLLPLFRKAKPIVHLACSFLEESIKIAANYGLPSADPKTTTPLHMAVEQGHKEAVQKIVRLADDLEVGVDTLGMTPGETRELSPLGVAVFHDNPGIVEILLNSKHINVDSTTLNYGRTPLFLVKSAVVARLLCEKKADVNHPDKERRTPLFTALFAQNQEIVQVLLANKADPTVKDYRGYSPLHYVQYASVVQELVKAGADTNATDNDGKTPLHYAKSAEVAQALIEENVDVNATDNAGKTPLHCAQYASVVQELVKAGADMNATDNDGKAPLHCAQIAEVVRELYKDGADVNAKDKYGKTPLHYAQYASVVQELVKAGADMNATDNDGNTPFKLAKDRKVIQKLIELGAKTQWEDLEAKDDKEDFICRV
ncbi:MAG: ankyrin repeat domain-containing protein [Holosporaceae bacterium]|nr:ankyrin repeat domain-containing protein [Holosporaceae bacterium]